MPSVVVSPYICTEPGRRGQLPLFSQVVASALGRALMLLFAICVLAASMQSANAHALRENYVWVNVETDHLSGRFELNARDIKSKLGIDLDAIGADRLAGVRASADKVQQYLVEHFAILDGGQPMAIQFGPPGLFEGGSDFVQYPYRTSRLPSNAKVEIQSRVFLTEDMMKNDRLHRSVLVVAYNKAVGKDFGEETVALVFSPSNTSRTLNLDEPSTILSYKDFIWQGALHIWAGIDHVLFLVVLLLTSVLRYSEKRWEPEPRLRTAGWNILVIVTVFTVAHSITFGLTALGFITVNTALIETIIAASIIAVALNNIYPRYAAHAWVLIFIFGLFHGIGFASAMSDLQFRNVLIHKILLRFNIGVELGQLAIVAVVFPLLFWLRKKAFYQRWVVYPFSIAAIVLAALWVLQRSGVLPE
ncbi:MAG: HupE/UreJ family protein [Burkholderiaceae bacterium]